MKFGNRLEIALTVMEWTVTDLARICNVADTTIGAIIRRNSDRSNYSEQIIKAFPPDKVSHEWLRSGVGSAKPKPVDEFTERRLSGSVRSAGIDVLLERLSHHLTLMDAGSKRRAGLLLADLANAPGDHASIAAAHVFSLLHCPATALSSMANPYGYLIWLLLKAGRLSDMALQHYAAASQLLTVF